MARDQSAIVNWTQFLGLRAIDTLMQCFDVDENLRTAAAIGSTFARMNPRRMARAERNLALSFPEWPRERVASVAERSMQNMFQIFIVEALITPRLITPESWPRYVRFGRVGAMLEKLLGRGPVILVTGHCGNWELLGYTLAMLGFPLSALARPVDNPLINRWLMGIREARGLKIITKWGATSHVVDLLRSGGRVGFIADQDAGEQSLFVPFFGRLAACYKSMGLLAMRLEVPIVCGIARRLDGRFRYEIDCADMIEPDDWVDRPDPLFYITARLTRAIEEMIRTAPEQYLWIHRRWKSRPAHEREGKPMPSRLREKLEALPWLAPAELERIVELSNDPTHVEVR